MESALSEGGRVLRRRPGWQRSYGGGRRRYYAPCHGLHPFKSFHSGTLTRKRRDRKSTRLNSSHLVISYAVFCLKKKKHEMFFLRGFLQREQVSLQGGPASNRYARVHRLERTPAIFAYSHNHSLAEVVQICLSYA